uniref:Beta-hydroxylase, bleomycin/phleomycin binding protein, ankyrin homologue, bleomycin and transport protein n=1 Tax=Streptomyces verticillus TaxID=29309 RepID=Q53797_9ACTN|nr:ORF3 [Streptomyces verticillus]prf//2104260F bleomycin resistance-enhancing protein [Streptomyces verticillus]prf//2104261F bleomycin resistance-enhancing protein [Streptomyces verticillus]
MSDPVLAAQTSDEPGEHLTARPANPGQLGRPAFLMNAPFSYSCDVANNVWMEDLTDEERVPDPSRAFAQFLDLYNYVAAEALVALLPTPRTTGLQDLVFTANLGIVLEHLPDRNTVVISRYTSPPRQAETPVGERFFEAMGYETHVPETHFEGEAELKHLHGNVYAGGYGQRSDRETYDWMERAFGMEVVKLRMTDPRMYHLDCTVFPLTPQQTLVCTSLYDRAEIRELEKHTEIIDVGEDETYTGICNSVRLNNVLLNSSHIHDLKSGTEEYDSEVRKNRALEDIASRAAFEVTYFNLSEYHKGGALLSCMVMHLNRFSYAFPLL